MAEHGRLAEELGGGAWLRQVGNLNWEEEPAAHSRLRETVLGLVPPRVLASRKAKSPSL